MFVSPEEEKDCETRDNDQSPVDVKGECEGEEPVFFSVGEVRRRLSQHITAPKKTFDRDPEDPSGI